MYYILGIDQSYTSSGYCVIDESKAVIDIGTIKTAKDVDGDIYDRAATVARKLIELADKHGPMRIGMEGLAFAKFGNATRDLAGLQFVLITQFRTNSKYGSSIEIVSPNLLKKFATDKGNASKDEMAAALPPEVRALIDEKKLKKSTGLYDCTDAYWLAQYTLEAYKKSSQK